MSVILKEAKEELRLVKQLLYVMLSAHTNNPLNLAINSPSGEDKNWVLEKVAEKFPSEDVVFLSGTTDKALFHGKGILVINKNDIDKNSRKEYVPVDPQIEELDNQIQNKENEINNTKNTDLIKALKAIIKELEEEKKEIYKNAKKLIDLSHKILVFLDTPRINLLSTMMPLLSHDRYEAEYEYVDTHNGIKTRTNILRGWPAVIFAQAIDYTKHERWPELQRRFIVTNPEMNSKKKYSDAVDLTLDKFGLPDLVYQKIVSSDDEKDTVKRIIKSIGEEIRSVSDRINSGKNSTCIPFSEALKKAIPKNKSSDMNAAKRFSGFLSLLPMINIGKRPMIKIHTFAEDGSIMQTVTFALFEDLRESIYLMEYANGVRPYVLEWYYDVFLPTYETHKDVACKLRTFGKTEQWIYESRIAVTTQELIAKTRETKDKSYNSNQLLQTFVYPLLNQGYIDSTESELVHRAHIYFPVITGKYIKLLQNDEYDILLQISKVNVIDSTIFPDKTYLISRIQWVLRCYYEEGIRTTLCDHEGKEISIDELVERYFDKPEDYFELTGVNGEDNDGNDDDKKEHKEVDDRTENTTSNNNISEACKKKDVSQENPAEDERTGTVNYKVSNKILHDIKYNNIINSSLSNPVIEGSSPDPSLMKTTRFLNNLREEYDECQCSRCQYKEPIWKNRDRPISCANCKSLLKEK